MLTASQCFRNAYDATYRLRPTRYLNQISVTSFLPGDYVMVECTAMRVASGQTGWEIRFALSSIYKLHRQIEVDEL